MPPRSIDKLQANVNAYGKLWAMRLVSQHKPQHQMQNLRNTIWISEIRKSGQGLSCVMFNPLGSEQKLLFHCNQHYWCLKLEKKKRLLKHFFFCLHKSIYKSIFHATKKNKKGLHAQRERESRMKKEEKMRDKEKMIKTIKQFVTEQFRCPKQHS